MVTTPLPKPAPVEEGEAGSEDPEMQEAVPTTVSQSEKATLALARNLTAYL